MKLEQPEAEQVVHEYKRFLKRRKTLCETVCLLS